MDLLRRNGFDRSQPLSERTLASVLNVGRTPVREAIRDLARDGILEVVPGHGTFVRRWSLDDLREMYEVRHALEGMAAQLAAQQGASDCLASYEGIFTALAEDPAARPEVIQRHNDPFHLAIFASAENGTLTGFHETLRARINASLHMTRRHDPVRVRQTIIEHLAVVRAIVAGDADGARDAMHTHLSNGYAARVQILVAKPSQESRL